MDFENANVDIMWKYVLIINLSCYVFDNFNYVLNSRFYKFIGFLANVKNLPVDELQKSFFGTRNGNGPAYFDPPTREVIRDWKYMFDE